MKTNKNNSLQMNNMKTVGKRRRRNRVQFRKYKMHRKNCKMIKNPNNLKKNKVCQSHLLSNNNKFQRNLKNLTYSNPRINKITLPIKDKLHNKIPIPLSQSHSPHYNFNKYSRKTLRSSVSSIKF